MTTDRHCLDAETVAAWMDGGLDAAGVAAAEAHASTCERCQALLASVVKSLPMEDPLATGHEARGTARFWRWWLAPVAAAAAAVTIWMVVPQTPMQAPMEPPAASAPVRDRPEATDTRQQKPADAQADAAAAPPAATPPTDSFSPSRRNRPTAARNESKTTVAEAAKMDQQAAGRTDAQGKREETRAVGTDARQAAAEPAPAAAAERSREAPAAPAIGAVAQLRKQTAPLQIVSPDPNRRWRVMPGGIERSEDAGRIWIPVRLAGKEEIIGGASPGPLVCWLVGRNGLVLLATDGTNFTRLPFPESVDLVSVSSPQARIAIVTTADGRSYRTDDGGRTWQMP